MSESCANCGAEVLEGARFCDNCGMPVSETAPPREEAPPLQRAPTQDEQAPSPAPTPPVRRSGFDLSSAREGAPSSQEDAPTEGVSSSPLLHSLPKVGQSTNHVSSAQQRGEKRSPRRLLVLGGLAVVTLLIVGIAAWGLVPYGIDAVGSETVTLPDVVGMSGGEAEKSLSSEGFEVETESGKSTEESAGKVVEQSPSGGSEAEKNSTVTLAVGEEPSQEEASEEPLQEEKASKEEDPSKPAAGFTLLKHDSGNLSVEIPSEWGERITGKNATFEGDDVNEGEGVGPGLTASTNLNAWQVTGDPVPGIFVAASRELAQQYTVGQLLNSGFNDQSDSCTPGASQNLDRSPYSGKVQAWSCEDGNTTYTFATMPESRECVVMLQVMVYSEADRNAAQRIFDTVEADCESIS